MSLCKDCVTGVVHEGTAEGTFTTINGVECHVVTPSIDYPKDVAILFLPDVFGIHFINNQLLMDSFAKNGFKVIGADYFNGDPLPAKMAREDDPSSLEAMKDPDFNFMGWFKNHDRDRTRPPLDKVVESLKAEGITKLGGAGYCFGGRYAFDLAFDHLLDVVVVFHPSLLKVPDDLEKYSSIARAPLLINSCTNDEQFTYKGQVKADEILGGGRYRPGYDRKHWEGYTHGFAARGDLGDPNTKAAKEGAFNAGVQWFHRYL